MWRNFQRCLRNDTRLVPLSTPRRYVWMHAQGIPHWLSLPTQHASPPIGFWCPNAMNDPPVSNPVVKLASMTHNAFKATLTFNTTVMPPPCTIQPSLPPPEPPPIDVVPGEGHVGTVGTHNIFLWGRLQMIRTSLAPARPPHLLSFWLMIQGISILIV
jgi:hypothetical protein